MIARLRGRVVAKERDALVVDTGNIGYRVVVPRPLLEMAEGEEVLLHTHLVVREDEMSLYGFAREAERRLFVRLMGVNGVGPRLALALLSSLRPEELAGAVRRGDRQVLQGVPGIGRKTAERLLVELKDVLEEVPEEPAPPGEADEAVAALLALGVRPQEAAALLEGLPDGPTEERVRLALRRLGGEEP